MDNSSIRTLLGALSSYANTQDVSPTSKPMAYLNCIILDNSFQSAASGPMVPGPPIVCDSGSYRSYYPVERMVDEIFVVQGAARIYSGVRI